MNNRDFILAFTWGQSKMLSSEKESRLKSVPYPPGGRLLIIPVKMGFLKLMI
jgi:hypothetical protein